MIHYIYDEYFEITFTRSILEWEDLVLLDDLVWTRDWGFEW